MLSPTDGEKSSLEVMADNGGKIIWTDAGRSHN
jgi:hypothetical protein